MELIDLYANAQVSPQYMLTTSKHVSAADITAPLGLKTIEDSLVIPLRDLEQMCKIKLTDFTALVEDWRTIFKSRAFIYNPEEPSRVMDISALPHGVLLYQNYPNPFNASTAISFQSSENSHVTLKVFDVSGCEVARVVDDELTPGVYSIVYDTKHLSSGIYFYRLQAGRVTQQKKMAVLK